MDFLRESLHPRIGVSFNTEHDQRLFEQGRGFSKNHGKIPLAGNKSNRVSRTGGFPKHMLLSFHGKHQFTNANINSALQTSSPSTLAVPLTIPIFDFILRTSISSRNWSPG